MLRLTWVLLASILLTATVACSNNGGDTSTQGTESSEDAKRNPGTGPAAPILSPQQRAASLTCNREKNANSGQPKRNGECKKSCDANLLPKAECDYYFNRKLFSPIKRNPCDEGDYYDVDQCSITCQEYYDAGKVYHERCEKLCPGKVCQVQERFRP